MRSVFGLFGLGLLAFCASTSFIPVPLSSLSVVGPSGEIAPRDSLPYTLRWRPVARATAYRVTVTASAMSNGVTTSTGGLPFGAVTTDTTFSFTAVNLTYDSIAFTASVTATSGTRSGLPGSISWSVVRGLGTPTIQVDSSAIPPLASLDVALPLSTLAIGQSEIACAFGRSLDGHAYVRTQDFLDCANLYTTRYTSQERNVPLASQLWFDSQCIRFTSLNPSIATVANTDPLCQN